MYLTTQKKIVAALLILFVIAAIAFLIWFLRTGQVPGLPKQQPPSLPSAVQSQPEQPSPSAGTPTTPAVNVPATPASPTMSRSEQERQAEDALKRDALMFASRVGSYSNADGFSTMKEVYASATDQVKTYLDGERQKLVQAHPQTGTSYGQTMRSLSAQITDGLPLLSSSAATVLVQTYHTIDDNNVQVSDYQQATLSYVKKGDAWLVDKIVWHQYTP